jgi:hypothetical protein
MATSRSKRGDDLTPLEGASAGGGGTGGTKWSGMPSFRGNASMMDDLKKLTAPPTKAKGAAKRSVELAEDRAASRMVGRAAATGAVAAGAKAMSGKDAKAKEKDEYEDMAGDVKADSSNPTGVAGTGMKSGGLTASRRADGIAQRGKTKGKVC